MIHYFQVKQADSIYALAGEKFKSQLTAESFKNISETQIFPLNNFQQVSYVSTTNGINKYKVAGSPDLQLLISIDKENKLETLLIQPFSDNRGAIIVNPYEFQLLAEVAVAHQVQDV